MKFINTDYELKFSNRESIYLIDLYKSNQLLMSIKLDIEYLLSLYGFLDKLYLFGESFEMHFPISNPSEKYSLYAKYNEITYLNFVKEDINGQQISYEIKCDYIENCIDLMQEIDPLVIPYIPEDEYMYSDETMNELCSYYYKRKGKIYNRSYIL